MVNLLQTKRGSVVDWAISMGIFIMAVTAILATLQPASIPEQTPKMLEEIAHQVIRASAVEMSQTPVIISRLDDVDSSGNPVVLTLTLQGTGWEFTNITESSIGGTPLTITPGATSITLQCVSNCLNREVTLAFMKRAQGDYYLEKQCNTLDTFLCNATIGATRSIEGIDKNKLLQLSDYATLKSNLHLPENIDFGIYLNQPFQHIIVQGPPKQQGPVFALQRSTWFITPDGSRTPAQISVRMW